MSTITTLATRLFTLDEYHHLTEIGFFQSGDRIELIRGEIVKMAAKGRSHVVCCRNLLTELPPLLIHGQVKLQCQDPITLPSGSEPEPDFAIVRMREDNYLSSHPSPADILLVIEISDSSLSYDRDIKDELYAEAGLCDYWIFNLVDRRLETYSEPYQDRHGKFNYAKRLYILPNQAIAIPGFPQADLDLGLDLAKVFP